MGWQDETYNNEIDFLLTQRLTSKELIRLSTEAFIRCMERHSMKIIGGADD